MDVGHLAAYAGLTPVTRRSGTSIRGEFPRPIRQQAPQTSPIPLILRCTAIRPELPGLLRPQTSPRLDTQGRTHLPLTTTLRRPLHHAPQPRAIPAPQPGPTTGSRERYRPRYCARARGLIGVRRRNGRSGRPTGELWAGQGCRVTRNGRTLVSRNGMRTYRPPALKRGKCIYQTNFENWIGEREGRSDGNHQQLMTDMS